MDKNEFKEKWFDNAFYWVNEDNFVKLQEMMQCFGILPHFGSGMMQYNPKIKNLATFKPDKWHDFEYYQQSAMFIPGTDYGEPKNYQEMTEDYLLCDQ